MSKPSIPHLTNLTTLMRYGLVVLVIIFISFLFPNETKFKYEFELGSRWNYEDLIAPQDFPIGKTEEEQAAERKALEQNFSPYFEMDTEVASRKKLLFSDAFRDQLEIARRDSQFTDVQRNADRYIKYGNHFIDGIYTKGVIQTDPQLVEKGKDFVINIRVGNTTKVKTVEDFLTSDEIELMIGDSLFNSGLKEAEFLIPLLKNLFTPNLTYNDTLTKKFINEELGSVSKSRGMVLAGERIVSRGELINDEVYRKLVSYRNQYESGFGGYNQSKLGIFFGYLLLTSLIVGVFILFLQFNARRVFIDLRKLSFMMTWLVIYAYLVYLVDSTQVLSAYMIPFCIVPIVIKVFFNDRLALFSHIVVVLIASILSSEGYEFTFLQILAGIVVILSNINVRNWSRFFFSLFFIFLAYALGYLGLSLIKVGSLAEVDWSVYNWLILNVILTLLAYPLIPLLERVFGFTSAITLVELSDMNRPLLKELSLKAPGTMQHSLQVGNLAEAAAAQIGADTLLVKVAALYHDIGKVRNPQYFIENLSGESPHLALSHLQSAKIIIEHVTDGVKMAKKAGLPQVIIDFIRTHHGTTRVEYFYRKYLIENPDGEADQNRFRYPGPRPRTKEETILMIADSLEAASKSIKNPSGHDIDELVEKIIAGKITHHQLEDSEMTFQELETCKVAFKKLLKSINHVRIEYPKEAGEK